MKTNPYKISKKSKYFGRKITNQDYWYIHKEVTSSSLTNPSKTVIILHYVSISSLYVT
jgi:hypothetical protein